MIAISLIAAMMMTIAPVGVLGTQTVQAGKPSQWCFDSTDSDGNSGSNCWSSHADCRADEKQKDDTSTTTNCKSN
jgi:hypothetical protein